MIIFVEKIVIVVKMWNREMCINGWIDELNVVYGILFKFKIFDML